MTRLLWSTWPSSLLLAATPFFLSLALFCSSPADIHRSQRGRANAEPKFCVCKFLFRGAVQIVCVEIKNACAVAAARDRRRGVWVQCLRSVSHMLPRFAGQLPKHLLLQVMGHPSTNIGPKPHMRHQAYELCGVNCFLSEGTSTAH